MEAKRYNQSPAQDAIAVGDSKKMLLFAGEEISGNKEHPLRRLIR